MANNGAALAPVFSAGFLSAVGFDIAISGIGDKLVGSAGTFYFCLSAQSDVGS